MNRKRTKGNGEKVRKVVFLVGSLLLQLMILNNLGTLFRRGKRVIWRGLLKKKRSNTGWRKLSPKLALGNLSHSRASEERRGERFRPRKETREKNVRCVIVGKKEGPFLGREDKVGLL